MKTMKTLNICIFILLLLACVSCKTPLRVPDGIYLAQNGDGKIESGKDGLIFTIYAPNIQPQNALTRGPYTYDMEPSGEIRIHGSSNDSIFLFVIMDNDWSWDGKNIVRKERKSGKTQMFTIEP